MQYTTFAVIFTIFTTARNSPESDVLFTGVYSVFSIFIDLFNQLLPVLMTEHPNGALIVRSLNAASNLMWGVFLYFHEPCRSVLWINIWVVFCRFSIAWAAISGYIGLQLYMILLLFFLCVGPFLSDLGYFVELKKTPLRLGFCSWDG